MSQITKPGNKGWNDPPILTHQNTPARKNLLSKRVSNLTSKQSPNSPLHPPLLNSSPNLNQLPSTLAPPQFHGPVMVPSMQNLPPQFHGPVIVPTIHNSAQQPSHQPHQPITTPLAKDPMSDMPVRGVCEVGDLVLPSFHDDDQMLHYTTTRLHRCLSDCANTSQKRVLDEIRKKLLLFEGMWKSHDISYPVKSSMATLATAIHRRHFERAEELQMILVLDFITETSKWCVAVKRLIQEAAKISFQTLSPSVSCVADVVDVAVAAEALATKIATHPVDTTTNATPVDTTTATPVDTTTASTHPVEVSITKNNYILYNNHNNSTLPNNNSILPNKNNSILPNNNISNPVPINVIVGDSTRTNINQM